MHDSQLECLKPDAASLVHLMAGGGLEQNHCSRDLSRSVTQQSWCNDSVSLRSPWTAAHAASEITTRDLHEPISTGAAFCLKGMSKRRRNELLWPYFFSDPSKWWNGNDELGDCDLRDSRYKEALRLQMVCKPARQSTQLASRDVERKLQRKESQMFESTPASNIEIAHIRSNEERQLKEAVQALDLQLQRGACFGNSVFYRLLERCTAQKNLTLGEYVHGLCVRAGVEEDEFLANHIIRMYAAYGKLEEAMKVFTKVPAPDTFMWYSIISAHACNGQPAEAINLYRQMRQSSAEPNSYVFVAVVKACTISLDVVAGKEVHADIVKAVADSDMFVGSCLVDMYAKCGRLEDARRVFDKLPVKDVVAWTAMIAAYAQQGLGQEALVVYANMEEDGLTPTNKVTFVCLLQACGSVGALLRGKQLHGQIERRGLESDVMIGSCLVDMYAKCGSLVNARKVFAKIPTRDVVVWNALLNGYAQHSKAEAAMQCFEEMQQQNVLPDGVTFLCLIVACSRECLVHEGRQYFKFMLEDRALVPTVHHYSSMVDLFARAGLLDEAEALLHSMPFQDDDVGWRSLLSACRSHGDAERGKRCFDRLVALKPESAVAYVLLGSIYVSARKWKDAERIECLRISAGAWKKPAKACIEVKNKVHEFVVGEERADISSKLRNVNVRAKEEGGHVPQIELVQTKHLATVKEDALCGHAEKLALAYGLLNTPAGTPLLVTKNLRMCSDCHSTTKIMSRVEKREIVVRDVHRVHNFVDGFCGCQDRN